MKTCLYHLQMSVFDGVGDPMMFCHPIYKAHEHVS